MSRRPRAAAPPWTLHLDQSIPSAGALAAFNAVSIHPGSNETLGRRACRHDTEEAGHPKRLGLRVWPDGREGGQTDWMTAPSLTITGRREGKGKGSTGVCGTKQGRDGWTKAALKGNHAFRPLALPPHNFPFSLTPIIIIIT